MCHTLAATGAAQFTTSSTIVHLRRLFKTAALLLSALLIVSHALEAQETDVIRGTVTGPEGQPIANAQVVVTSFSGNVNRNGRTDRGGKFSITFPNGDGNYMVTVTSLGYAMKRFEIRRIADEDFLLADAKLERVGTVLDQINTVAARSRVSRNANDAADISGTERTLSSAGLPPDMMGDLAAMAAQLPGMQAALNADGSSGYSAFGLGADQNNATLNNMNFGGAGLPRDANVSSSVVSSPFDVSRGGFSGAQTMLRTRSGTNFLQRRGSSTFNAPQMQWTDRIGRASGAEYLSASPGGSISGPIVFDKAFYNISAQLGRTSSDLQTLLNTDPLALQASGISADSVARLTSLLQSFSVPSSYSGLPGSRLSDNGSLLGSLDFTPPSSNSGTAWNVTFGGGWSRSNPMVAGAAASRSLPTALGQNTSWNGSLQARHSAYFGYGILTETSLGLSMSDNESSPYVDLPSGRIRINSSFADGTSGVQTLAFGGNQQMGTTSSSNSLQAMNMLSWFSGNNKHRLKLTTEVRRDASSQDNTVNRLGTYTYNSLEDLQLDRPATYTRQLSPRIRDGGQYIGSVSLGDSYRYSQNLQFQLGVRVDANKFMHSPTLNPDVESQFGVRNDHVPEKVLVSPRVGFSWMYGTGAQISAFQGAFRGPRAVLRGGIGMFQSHPSSNLIGNAIDNTGLPTGVQQLLCVGDAVPLANWQQFAGNPASVPDRCEDGTTGSSFASGAPNVTLFDKDYTTPRSIRSTLGWSGPILANLFNGSVDLTYSMNLNQAGFIDRNFNSERQFALNNEANRPVFAPSSSVVPTSGAIAANASRISNDFLRVTEMRSDLSSVARQASFRISPLSFTSNFSWSLSYTHANIREQYQGFNSTAGDPLAKEWGRSSFDSRHQFVYNLSWNAFDFIRISWFGQLRSGNPYTPTVSGDINGDGYNNDRAFVFDPASASDPALAAGMRSLLNRGDEASRCLSSQLGAVANRNSCQGPWQQFASLNFSFNPLKVRMPQRATLSFNVQNPLGAADLLLNGENKLRGWGQQRFPDASLLYVRGFDPTTQQFRYEVNERFGATNPAYSAQRNPVILTAMLSLDLSPPRERQLLTQALDRGRRNSGAKPTEPLLKAQFGNAGVPNPLATLLRDQDTLSLSTQQADSIASMNRRYIVTVDSIWAPVVKYWATLPDDYVHDDAYDRYRKAREASIDVLISYASVVRGMLSREQYRKLPPFIASALDKRYLRSIRSSTINASSGALGGGAGMMMIGGMGGTTITGTVIAR